MSLPIPREVYGYSTDGGFWPAGIVKAWAMPEPLGVGFDPFRVCGEYADGTRVELVLTRDGKPIDFRTLCLEFPDPSVVVRLEVRPSPKAEPEPERRHPHEPIHLPASRTGVLWCLLAAAACAVFVLCTYLIWSVR